MILKLFYTPLFAPGLVLATSILLFQLFGRKRVPPGRLLAALNRALETIGLTVLCFVGNVIVGLCLIDLARLATHVFISHYIVSNILLIPFSLFQALIARSLLE